MACCPSRRMMQPAWRMLPEFIGRLHSDPASMARAGIRIPGRGGACSCPLPRASALVAGTQRSAKLCHPSICQYIPVHLSGHLHIPGCSIFCSCSGQLKVMFCWDDVDEQIRRKRTGTWFSGKLSQRNMQRAYGSVSFWWYPFLVVVKGTRKDNQRVHSDKALKREY